MPYISSALVRILPTAKGKLTTCVGALDRHDGLFVSDHPYRLGLYTMMYVIVSMDTRCAPCPQDDGECDAGLTAEWVFSSHLSGKVNGSWSRLS